MGKSHGKKNELRRYTAYEAIDLIRQARKEFGDDEFAAIESLPPPVALAVERIGWTHFASNHLSERITAEARLVGLIAFTQDAFFAKRRA